MAGGKGLRGVMAFPDTVVRRSRLKRIAAQSVLRDSAGF